MQEVHPRNRVNGDVAQLRATTNPPKPLQYAEFRLFLARLANLAPVEECMFSNKPGRARRLLVVYTCSG